MASSAGGSAHVVGNRDGTGQNGSSSSTATAAAPAAGNSAQQNAPDTASMLRQWQESLARPRIAVNIITIPLPTFCGWGVHQRQVIRSLHSASIGRAVEYCHDGTRNECVYLGPLAEFLAAGWAIYQVPNQIMPTVVQSVTLPSFPPPVPTVPATTALSASPSPAVSLSTGPSRLSSQAHAAVTQPGTLQGANGDASVGQEAGGTPEPRAKKLKQSKKEGKTPRPPNSWILYRAYRCADFAKRFPKSTNIELSSLIAEEWKANPVHGKPYWQQKAREARDEHSKLNPGYRYAPTSKRSAKEPVVKQPPQSQTLMEADQTSIVDASHLTTDVEPFQSNPGSPALSTFQPASSSTKSEPDHGATLPSSLDQAPAAKIPDVPAAQYIPEGAADASQSSEYEDFNFDQIHAYLAASPINLPMEPDFGPAPQSKVAATGPEPTIDQDQVIFSNLPDGPLDLGLPEDATAPISTLDQMQAFVFSQDASFPSSPAAATTMPTADIQDPLPAPAPVLSTPVPGPSHDSSSFSFDFPSEDVDDGDFKYEDYLNADVLQDLPGDFPTDFSGFTPF
ncbi:uncharacterized protein B0I36DRAFT_403016 [Microdochium trichocladiopsis]|uniref:HMG box domain-containing protein n=1 Tax=Microdochium trichocladiopsis TaxID=1682393 RepID=A0A9P9BUC4_9PEZI|nr:uncharacterized protein B0I36DRAFT_403016 [Microdochium trichocladiopsis]KAH7037481.1 hypothetical protein B0I36DRAFT_403016 [Microdochium trichocladiopsis]